MKNTVIYHSADYDGIFCREIARKFLPPDTEFIGWNFGDRLIAMPPSGAVYVLDLSPECLKDYVADPTYGDRLIWIDHHKTSIDKWPREIPGYRIDGVAACRLTWQWFQLHAQWDNREQHPPFDLPKLEDYVERKVPEPLAVRLVGEYDIWDKRDPRAEWFQFGLDGTEVIVWKNLLDQDFTGQLVGPMCLEGCSAQRVIAKRDADMMKTRSFKARFEGLIFLCLNIAKCNSLTFAALDIPETGHDALMGFYWNGKTWAVSLYHAKHNTTIDLSLIAKKFKGGGHRGACGFAIDNLPGTSKLPFIPA